jgi:Family of unknown function (DUF6941)
MMEARYLILARYAEFTTEGTLNMIGGDGDKIVAEEYPYAHPDVIAAARIVLQRDDCASAHTFRSVIVDSETEEIVAEGPAGMIPPLVMPPNARSLGTGLLLRFPAPIFPREGRYHVQLIVDELVLARTPLRVAPLAYYQSVGKIQPTTEEEANGSTNSTANQ